MDFSLRWTVNSDKYRRAAVVPVFEKRTHLFLAMIDRANRENHPELWTVCWFRSNTTTGWLNFLSMSKEWPQQLVTIIFAIFQLDSISWHFFVKPLLKVSSHDLLPLSLVREISTLVWLRCTNRIYLFIFCQKTGLYKKTSMWYRYIQQKITTTWWKQRTMQKHLRYTTKYSYQKRKKKWQGVSWNKLHCIALKLHSVQHWRSTETCASALGLPKLSTGTDLNLNLRTNNV